MKSQMLNKQEIFLAIIERNGLKEQINKCLEELTELSLVLHHITKNPNMPNLIKEIADVTWMTQQLSFAYNIENEVDNELIKIALHVKELCNERAN